MSPSEFSSAMQSAMEAHTPLKVIQHSIPNGGDLLSPNFTITGTVRAFKAKNGILSRVYVDWEDGISNWIEPQHLEIAK